MSVDPRFEQYRASREGDRDRQLRNELIVTYKELAEMHAGRYSGRGVERQDLEQVAMLGLVKAVERFDPEVGVKFETYAGRLIEGEIKRYFRDRTWAVHVPRRAQALTVSIRQVTERLTQELERVPTVPELADELGIGVDDLLEAMEAGEAYRSASLDRPAAGSEDSGPVHERIGSTDEGFQRAEARTAIDAVVAKLPERERRILELRFGAGMTQSEIAADVGISQMHVSRLLRRTLAELREDIGSPMPPE